MRSALILIILVCFATACKNGKSFTSRKYTSGRYVSYTSHKQQPIKRNHGNETILAVTKSTNQENLDFVAVEQTSISNKACESKMKDVEERKDLQILKEERVREEKNGAAVSFNRKGNERRVASRINAELSKGPSKQALTAVICSGSGVIFDIAAIVVAVTTLEYMFLVLSVIGLGLGIVGLIFGIGSIKEYKEERRNGNKNTATLVLGIVGAAVGGLAIFLALYSAIVGAIFITYSPI